MKIRFGILCELSTKQTIHKMSNLIFSDKYKCNISNCLLLLLWLVLKDLWKTLIFENMPAWGVFAIAFPIVHTVKQIRTNRNERTFTLNKLICWGKITTDTDHQEFYKQSAKTKQTYNHDTWFCLNIPMNMNDIPYIPTMMATFCYITPETGYTVWQEFLTILGTYLI